MWTCERPARSAATSSERAADSNEGEEPKYSCFSRSPRRRPEGRRGGAPGLANSLAGLTQAEAEERARTAGPNEVAQERQARLARPPSENHPQPAGDPARRLFGGFLRYRRCARRNGDGDHGGAERGAALLAGSPSGCGGREAQGHDPRDRDGRAGRRGRGDAARETWCPATSSSWPPAT